MTPWPWDPDYPIWQHHWLGYPAGDDGLMPETAAVSAPAPEGQLFKLATKPTPCLQHKWPDITTWKRAPKACTPTRCEQIERACTAGCGLVKITVMEGRGYRAWRWGEGHQFTSKPVAGGN